MKSISLLLILAVLLFASLANAGSPDVTPCLLPDGDIPCERFRACREFIVANMDSNESNFPIRALFPPKNYVKLLKNVEQGNDCAIDLGFQLYVLALNHGHAGYLESTNDSLGLSVSSNPAAFLRYFPDELFRKEFNIRCISCAISLNFNEECAYIEKELYKRREALLGVSQEELITKRDMVLSGIEKCLEENELLKKELLKLQKSKK